MHAWSYGSPALLLLLACGTASPPPAGADGSVAGADAAPGTDATPAEDAASNDDAAAVADAAPADSGAGGGDTSTPPPPPDAGFAPDAAARQPVVFVHGINGSSAEFAVMIDRLVQDGWSRAQLHPVDFADPRWGCNADNAAAIRDAVEAALASSGATRVDLVAHSMGTLSARHYLKNLGGVDRVSTFVTLGGLHHGDRRACLNPLPVCVWQELCPTNPFLTQLNADPAAPGDLHYVSICSRTDGTVDLDVCRFDPAENIEVDGVDHAGANGLLEHPAPYPEVRRVLEYPSP